MSIRRTICFFLICTIGCQSSDTTQSMFTNPILSAADPWVVQRGDYYYVTYTTGENIELIRTAAMNKLSQGDIRTIWTPPSTGPNSGNIWGPELHFIRGKWYFYFAADDGLNENHRIWILENNSADPFEGTWTEKGKLQLPGDKWAIDGTILDLNDQLYFLWSGWEGDQNIRQNIYITKMSDPWTAEGDRVLLSSPEYAWEQHGGPPFVNEAPEWLIHDDHIYITFSASGCWTDEYSLGLLSANLSDNLMEAASWSKHPQPVLSTSLDNYAYGPGHNGFFKSKNGAENWIVYHANESAYLGCGQTRSVRMQKFTFQNGIPVFDKPVAVGLSIPVPAGE